MHIQTCDIGSFDDFLSYFRVPPVLPAFYFLVSRVEAGKATPLIVVPSVITCGVSTVDVELIKSGCMLLVDILTPLFG